MTETQNVEQAFSDLESAFEDLRQAPVRDFALGTLLMTGKALMSVRAARRDYAEFQKPRDYPAGIPCRTIGFVGLQRGLI